jgi:anti-sigma factor RsiW
MMDEATAELLSRLLDGDLDDVERRELEARLDREPGLRAELDSLRRLQAATRAVAERMEPPVELDDAVEQLRTGAVAMPRRRVPSAVRWLGVAAGLALAATVVLEVARQNPEPTLAPAAPTRDLGSETPGTEAPRPTLHAANEQPPADVISGSELDSSAGSPGAPDPAPAAEEKRRVDAPERPAEPPRESAPDAAEPVPEPSIQAADDQMSKTHSSDESVEKGRAEVVRDAAVQAAPVARAAPVGAKRRPAPAGAAAASSVAGKKAGPAAGSVPLELRDLDGRTVGTITFSGSWAGPDAPVGVTVAGGMIVAVDGQGGGTSDTTTSEGPADSLLGLAVEDVPDGRYLVVEADGSAP